MGSREIIPAVSQTDNDKSFWWMIAFIIAALACVAVAAIFVVNRKIEAKNLAENLWESAPIGATPMPPDLDPRDRGTPVEARSLSQKPPPPIPFNDVPFPRNLDMKGNPIPPASNHWFEPAAIIGLCLLNLLAFALVAVWRNHTAGITRFQQVIVIGTLLLLTWNVFAPPVVSRTWNESGKDYEWSEWTASPHRVFVYAHFDSTRQWISDIKWRHVKASSYSSEWRESGIASGKLLLFHSVVLVLSIISFLVATPQKRNSTS